MRKIKKDQLNIQIYPTREELGVSAAHEVADAFRVLLQKQQTISVIFASAPSQNEFLAALAQEELEWNRIIAFNMDEYVGIDPHAPQSFGQFLKERLYDQVHPKEVHLFNTRAEDPEAECLRYAALLDTYQPDICIYGVGENGHLAFNDPPVADFDDPKTVKLVEMDPVCRQQQVNDGCFLKLDEVPRQAFSLTIPALFRVPQLFGMVPGKTKIAAIDQLVNGPIATSCPSSILRRHPKAVLYLDEVSAEKVAD